MNNTNIQLLIKIGVIILLMFVFLKIVDFTFKKTEKIHLKFFRSFIKVLIVIIATIAILDNFEKYKNFSDTILTSSSLLVIVLGFAFQTSLSDFIAGIFISIFKPFEVNDRIILKNSKISGIIEDITIRHTVIKTFTNSRIIVPNSVINKELLENNHMEDTRSGNFLDVTIDYNTDIDLVKKIIISCIENHPKTINISGEEISNYTYVYTREFNENGIALRANVWTEIVDDNFLACSEIRDDILKKFKENNIRIPYSHREIQGNLNITNKSN